MTGINISPQLRELIASVENELGMEIVLHRQADAPYRGLLLDTYTYNTGKNVIVYPSTMLGLLKEFVIAENCVELLMRGTADRNGAYKVLSYDPDSAARGMNQIYLDTLKDEKTRNLGISQKKALLFSLYTLFHDLLSGVPWSIISHLYIATNFPVFRTAQVYFLLKEGLRDMHSLVGTKDFIPRRYFVLHNAIFYSRDMLMADVLGEFKLNPVISIPELQKFRNLDVKEMMTHRWQRSHWYHTKIVGDAMFNLLKYALPPPGSRSPDVHRFQDLYSLGIEITNSWITMMGMTGWYPWENPGHLMETEKNQDEIGKIASLKVFGD